MYVVRNVFHCKPGKVRPLVEKFKALAPIMEKMGARSTRILTDVSGQPSWTMISEVEVENFNDYLEMTQEALTGAEVKSIMEGYHDLVDNGQREILKLET